MDINQYTHIYFLGIGGIGMSALARYFHSRGVNVSGYDKTPTPLTEALVKEGIGVHFDEDISKIPGDTGLFIYTPAIPADSALFVHARNSGLPLIKRAEVLGLISNNRHVIAVAGTHGKTTITSMLAHIFVSAGIPVEALLGGISSNYDTNYLSHPDAHWLILEADEYDRSFLHLSPELAAITAMDADHLDIYGSTRFLRESFSAFTGKIRDSGTLLIKKGLEGLTGYHGSTLTYGLHRGADYYASDYRISEGKFLVRLSGKLETGELAMGLPGAHNIENAVAASALASMAGISADSIGDALGSFTGVKRRFEICYTHQDITYIDDYAHHPEELRACIRAARELFPGKKITGIFQPHLYSRTHDLSDEFADSLNGVDELILMDIYPAREKPIAGVSSKLIFDKIQLVNKQLMQREGLVEHLAKQDIEILITMGAGDIDTLVAPIKAMLERKFIP